MGLGRMTNNQSLTQTRIKPNNKMCITKALLVLRQTTGKFGLTRLITARISGKPHIPPYSTVSTFAFGKNKIKYYASRKFQDII
jgi:hypothetical protein